MTLSKTYKKSIKKQWYIKFNTKHPDGDSYYGFVLKEAESFIVIASFSELEYDGITILTKKYIKSLRDGENEKCINEILRFNGQIKKVKNFKWLDKCETMECIIKELMRRDVWPTIEVVSSDLKNSALYLGPIVGHGHKSFGLFGYSGSGKWEKEYILSFSHIFKIDLDTSYAKHFNNYMRIKTKVFPWEK